MEVGGGGGKSLMLPAQFKQNAAIHQIATELCLYDQVAKRSRQKARGRPADVSGIRYRYWKISFVT